MPLSPPRSRIAARTLAGAFLLGGASCASSSTTGHRDRLVAIADSVFGALETVPSDAFAPYADIPAEGPVLVLIADCQVLGTRRLAVMGGPHPPVEPVAADTAGCVPGQPELRGDSARIVVPLLARAYGASDTVATTFILAVHEWFHIAYQPSDRLFALASRSAKALASRQESRLNWMGDPRLSEMRRLLLQAVTEGGELRSVALRAYLCLRHAVARGREYSDSLIQGRETLEGPAIITSLRLAHAIGLTRTDPSEVVEAELRASSVSMPSSPDENIVKDDLYASAAALTLLGDSVPDDTASWIQAGSTVLEAVAEGLTGAGCNRE